MYDGPSTFQGGRHTTIAKLKKTIPFFFEFFCEEINEKQRKSN